MNNYSLRWDPYIMVSGNGFIEFWEPYLKNKERNVKFLIGMGFDTRMLIGLKKILEMEGNGKRDCILIDIQDSEDTAKQEQKNSASTNIKELTNLLEGRGSLEIRQVSMWSEDNIKLRIGPQKMIHFETTDIFENYTDVIVDVSSMRRSFFFPLIGNLLFKLDKLNNSKQLNLHVIVSESSKIDNKISPINLDESAYYVPGFSTDNTLESTSALPRIWIPILGENRRVQLERIHSLIDPEEICPVLPSPSSNPRRGDDLLIEYHSLLFDQWLIEPRNIVYVSEQNPFEVYRQITNTVLKFNSALSSLNGCKVILSAVSSKLLSLGVLLAAYELKQNDYAIAVAQIEASSYEYLDINIENDHIELFSMWLTGECYSGMELL